MKKTHECEVLRKTTVPITIEKHGDNWLWVFWDDKKGNQAHGIKYCPYCGVDIEKEETECLE